MKRLLVLLFLATLALPIPAAAADIGVGISASPIVLGEPARRGTTRDAGPVVVANTGTEAGTFGLRVEADARSVVLAVPADWVRFDAEAVELAPGERRAVGLSIRVPGDAAPGDYEALVFATAQPSAGPGGNRLGVQAATRLAFTVDSSPPARTRLPLTSPWVVVAAVGLTAVAAFTFKQAKEK